MAEIIINPSVLKWARESIALNRSTAVESLGINLQRLDQIERGEKTPTLDELRSMSKTYKRTIATLLLQNIPEEKPLPPDRRTVDSKQLGHFHDKTIMAVRKARALVQSLISLKKENNITLDKFPFSATLNDNPNLVANHVRSELRLNECRDIVNINEALEAYIERVESRGVAVFQLSLTQDNLRGFSIVDDAMPIIAIKRGGEPPSAKIFTLFHELGHIILNEGGICDISFDASIQQIEKWCNAFSAELLVPNKELLSIDSVHEKTAKNNQIWTKTELIAIGNKFHVGPLVILRRLLENQLTTREFYEDRHNTWNKPTFGRAKVPEGRNLPKETINEKGRMYVTLAFKAFDQNKIDLKDLSDFLGVRLSYIPKTRQLLNN